MIHVGFTGTQVGMTFQQKMACIDVLDGLRRAFWAHHGDCIGADEHFHALCRMRPHCAGITGHIPDNDKKRAFCQFDVELMPKPYLVRNRDIVVDVDIMIATPRQADDQPFGSGTWWTIRCARRIGQPLALVLPSGQVEYERWPTQVRLPW